MSARRVPVRAHAAPRIARGGCLAFAACIALLACEPQDRRPGTWLRGEEAASPVADWSFSDAHPEVWLETRTWYGIPHSVTTVCATANGNLYVPSLYFEGGTFPEARYWNRNVARDPRVRVKIGDRIHPLRAELVEDAAERQTALAAFAAKYPFWAQMLAKPESERPTIVLLRMTPRAQE